MKKASLFDLSDSIAIVTGALGQLGRQYCAALQEHGAKVVGIDIREIDSSSFGPNTLYLRADITNRADLVSALGKIESSWGTPNVLINNAALDSPPFSPAEENGPFETYPESSWDKIMEVNVKGTMLPCQVFGGAMAKNGGGSIINISSIYGLVSPNQDIYEYRRRKGEEFFKPVAYSASKSAIYNLTRYLATYWAKKNVRVNTLTLAGVSNNQAPEFLEEYRKRIPIGRMANPDEYNGAIVFLASKASQYMTGANLVIDGGWTAW